MKSIFICNQKELETIKKKFRVSFIKKQNSFFMKIIGWFIGTFIRTMTKKEFMENYVTTVFCKIYYTTEGSLSFPLLTHELTHVIQFGSLKILKYLTKSGRASLEGEALAAELEFLLLSGENITKTMLDNMANMLYNYGVGEKNVLKVKKKLLDVYQKYEKEGIISSDVALAMYGIFKERTYL